MRKFKCILLVDDDPVSNFIHYTILHKLNLGECICMCRNGKEALSFLEEYYQKHKDLPELILVDSFMPIMDALNLWRLMKKNMDLRNIPLFYSL
jgi:CheY-like chemotaxis protein